MSPNSTTNIRTARVLCHILRQEDSILHSIIKPVSIQEHHTRPLDPKEIPVQRSVIKVQWHHLAQQILLKVERRTSRPRNDDAQLFVYSTQQTSAHNHQAIQYLSDEIQLAPWRIFLAMITQYDRKGSSSNMHYDDPQKQLDPTKTKIPNFPFLTWPEDHQKVTTPSVNPCHLLTVREGIHIFPMTGL
jgi:hypothetical protein